MPPHELGNELLAQRIDDLTPWHHVRELLIQGKPGCAEY